MISKLKSPISWPGGKSWMADDICALIRARRHRSYIEVFAGGLAVLAAKERSGIEVINDIDGALVNFWRVLKHHPEALMLEILPLNSRLIFQGCAPTAGGWEGTDIMRAAGWWYRNRVSFAGAGRSWGVRHFGGIDVCARHPEIVTMAERLQDVAVECLPWERAIEIYDRREALFFFDPPYLGGDVANYQAWSAGDLAKFAGVVQALAGQWILTFNDCPEVMELLGRYRVGRRVRKRAVNNSPKFGGRVRAATELVFASPLRNKKHRRPPAPGGAASRETKPGTTCSICH